MITLALLFLGTVTVTIAIAYFLAQMDCDLEVLYSMWFGQPVDKLKGKVIWITGASSGVGEGLAYELARVGARLVVSGSNEARLAEVAAKCRQLQGEDADIDSDLSDTMALAFDITDVECHQEQLKRVLDRFQRLDILVNNAGKSQRAYFQDIDIEVDRAIFNVNVFGLINLTRLVYRYFLESKVKGQFAVTSSTAGIFGAPMSASYTATKHALHGYFESLRNEIGRKDIAISMLCIGPVHSNLAANVFTSHLGQQWEGRHEIDANRMATDRCAYLMAVAIANKIDQAWIAIQPVLLLHYLIAYLPQFTRKLFPRLVSMEKVNKLREGNRDRE